MKHLRIACIGSREISIAQKVQFENLGHDIVSAGHFLTSGNADGTDSAFAIGANHFDATRVILYLPWKNYNEKYIHPKNHVLPEPKPEWYDLTAPFHGGWQHLSRGARALMARNYGIIYRADKVLALLNHKKQGGGGTGQGVRIANSLKIPVLDLNGKSYDEIIEFLGF